MWLELKRKSGNFERKTSQRALEGQERSSLQREGRRGWEGRGRRRQKVEERVGR